jgi:uncharacterized RDD family membrane protein YckC
MIAFVADAVLCALVADLWTAPDAPGLWSYVPLGVLYVVAVPLTGQTLGMRLLRLRLVELGVGRVNPVRAALRFVLLALLIPALISDRDGRGLHDKAARTVVVRA